MRLQLNIDVIDTNSKLPLNYRYELSSWIYRVMYSSDNEFSKWLHDNGYEMGNRRFKLFTFSGLQIPKFHVEGDRLVVECKRMALEVSFFIDNALEHFVTGLFQNQAFSIGDRISRIECFVGSVEVLPEPVFSETMEFRSLSPVCVSRHRVNSSNKNAEYLSPKDEGYEKIFLDNLMRKFMALKNSQVPAVKKGSEHADITEIKTPMKLEVLNEPKSRLIRIKSFTPEETFVRGFDYRFRLTAPVEWMRLGYYAGFGEKNSLGFGCAKTN